MNLNGVSPSGFFRLRSKPCPVQLRAVIGRAVAGFAALDLVVLGRVRNGGMGPAEESLKVKDEPKVVEIK